MIIIDYNPIIIAPLVQGTCREDDVGLLRHIVLNTIRSYRQKFKSEYGEVILAADGGGNWRKKIFPQYKAHRKDDRDKSRIDWETAWESVRTITKEIDENLPYLFIKQYGCEADDTIAELCRYTQIFGNTEPVVIVASDYDYVQLLRWKNVKQFSPILGKFVNKSPHEYRKEHFITGCKGDGVPSALDDDNQLVEGRKKTTLTAKKKAQLLEDPKSLGPEIYQNYLRNKILIDLIQTKCPEDVREEIINKLESHPKDKNQGKLLNYLKDNDCRQLMAQAAEFIN